MNQTYDIRITAEARYIPEQSMPEEERYVFGYTITIHNRSHITVQLLSRHWRITDGNGKVEEVRGAGVVGQQPHIKPEQGFRYSSGAMLDTPVGTMEGSYQMLAEDGTHFDAEIPRFSLRMPHALH